ncbi:hypothetical protein BDW59DRAFT_159243 [Aspergillus cavernicola]|uniref:Urease accessory protein UreD n=1 Tax=Aspergillus cavernicola TaxID=176166 RepID=A0ABR4INA1_9EURO
MPHKHKRRQNDTNTYDLPPTLIAKALPVRDPSTAGKGKTDGKGKSKRKNNGNPNQKFTSKKDTKKPPAKSNPNVGSRRKSALDDDTPRAFRRLMQFQEQNQAASGGKSNSNKRKRDGEDSSDDSEGDATLVVTRKSTTKKKKKVPSTATSTTPTPTQTQTETTEKKAATAATPKILPGEKLSDFAARVDREMPLSAMKRSSNPSASGDTTKSRDQRTTKHEKHLRRLQAQWREDDVRIKEREAAEREEREEDMDEQLQLWKKWEVDAGKKKKNPNANAGTNGKKKKGGGGGGGSEGGVDDDGPDPWAKLKKSRAAVNPFDVAQEPPQLKKPKEKFKVRGGAKVDVANVPASMGSLRRREELASERRNIVEEYRRLMAERRQ